jgi:hypothetical protein
MKRACNFFSIKRLQNKKSAGKKGKRSTQRVLFSHKLYTSFMPDTKHPKCQHPKCGAKMQRIYKRDRAAFIPCGWMCIDCSMMLMD